MVRRWSTKRFDLYDFEVENDPYKIGFLPPPQEVVLESPLSEDQLLYAADEVFFYGMSSKSECLTVRVARGPGGESEAFVRLRFGDGRTYELREARGWQQPGSDKRAFSCGDLQVQHLSPMRRWRIFFNGVLMDMNTEKMVYVKFSFLWRALSDAFDFTTDVNTASLATGLSKAKWNQFRPPLYKFTSGMNCYVQAGAITGSATVEGIEKDVNLYLFGEKVRFLGETSYLKNAELCHVLGRTFKNGRLIHIIEASIPNVVENLFFGIVIQPNGAIENISDSEIDLKSISHEDLKESKIEATFISHGAKYQLQGTLFGEQYNVRSSKAWEGRFTLDPFNLHINSLKGSGLIIKGKMTNSVTRNIVKSSESQTPTAAPFVVHFSDRSCQNPDLTGGKGSSLGQLTELSKDLQNFVVPSGIVVTTAAYEQFLTKGILREIKNLEKCLYNNKGGDVKEACQRVMDEVIQSIMPADILQEVSKNLQIAFSGGKHSYKFAVRSSATGEDTEQMSAAGQMETYLGVIGINEIMLAVKKCWASQFSHIAVQYKKQNGQVLNSPMAVVVQQMVSCDVAGVLFTCDPLTGNPTRISITANYGLGETVVSGSEEPDTIDLRRVDEEKLIIKNKIIGSKNRRIVVKENEEGTNLEDVPEHDRKACCLTDEMALRLGNVAVKIEKCYRSRRDIEWGFWNNNLYIFQSRPVTSGTGESDFEIEHEFDAPLRTEEEYFTVCNVGEVMPGAMSPLGAEVLLKFFSIVFQKPRTLDWTEDHKPKYFPTGLCYMYNHIMFYCLDLLKRLNENEAATQATLISLFGRIIEDEDLVEMAREKHGHKKKSAFWLKKIENFARIRRVLYYTSRRLKQGQKKYANYRIEEEKYKSSQEMYNALLEACTDLTEAMYCHCIATESSSIWNMILFSLLKNARGELNSEVYGDFAKLLTTCSEVESADVPAALEKLAFYISKDIKPEDFKRMDTKEAVRWLQFSSTESGIKYREFILKHGHRCLKEFDIRSHTWETDPSSLIQLLQNLVGSLKSDKTKTPAEDINKLISQLRIPLTYKQKFMLKVLLIPMSRRAVQSRESSKSLLIRGVDAWRKGYTRLGQMMEGEGRIPDQDLIFFMRLEEIQELLDTRSPRIIAKANHRRRRHPTLDKYIFPEISKGFPMPINMETHPIVTNDDSFSMKGIPVSQGVTKGYVRVAVTLEEASFLQPGEILVTYSTDIGWSPYFPMLSGVVTELGGLISHGAVVSREYGLPCIAGLHGATRQFQTGDYVLMDGNRGLLQKLPNPEQIN